MNGSYTDHTLSNHSGKNSLVFTNANMVIGLLCIAAIPTVTGVGNAISAQKQQNAHMSKEQLKFNMGIEMARSGRMEEVGIGVLADNKVSFFDMASPATPTQDSGT